MTDFIPIKNCEALTFCCDKLLLLCIVLIFTSGMERLYQFLFSLYWKTGQMYTFAFASVYSGKGESLYAFSM